MGGKNPVEQKEGREHNAGYAIGGHEGKIHPAQVVWFYQLVLINEHGAKECNANIIWPANHHEESR